MGSDSKYYAMLLSENMEITPEGYLICKNVPICRSGTQEYLGSELRDFPGYEESWGLEDDKRYSVLRPRDEVLHPDTISSFEGKSVVDTHPETQNNTVTIENERYLNCGHIQDVKQGPDLDGEVTLQGDLHIKNTDLRDKVRPPNDPNGPDAVRDVSCGYTLRLGRFKSGQLYMHRIRGNHVAVVEKGRAGDRIAIRDSAPPEIIVRKVKIMNLRKLAEKIVGAGVEKVLPDASPEEKQSIASEIFAINAGKAAIDSKVCKACDKSPCVCDDDEEEEDRPKPRKSPMAADEASEAFGKYMKAKKSGADAAVVSSLRKDLGKYLDEEEKEPAHAEDALPSLKDAEEHQDEKTQAEEHDKMSMGDGEHAEKEIDDVGESVLKAANDSVREFIKTMKPVIAEVTRKPASRRTAIDKAMIDGYTQAVSSLNKVNGRLGASAYAIFARAKIPTGIPSAATDSIPKSLKPCTCFDGVPYAKGLKVHQETCMKEGK